MAYITESEFIKKATSLYRSIYKRNSGGCCLHCVIDDYNWGSVDEEEMKHKDCRSLAVLINQLAQDQRERIVYDHGTKTLSFEEEEEEDDYCPHCGRSG